MVIALVGCEEVGLVGRDDPVQVGRLDLGRKGQKAVVLAERGVLVHSAATRRRAHGLPVNEGQSILAPTLAVAQRGQRRAGEGVDRLAASGTTPLRQPMRLPPKAGRPGDGNAGRSG